MKDKLLLFYVKEQVKRWNSSSRLYWKNKLVNFKGPREAIGQLVDVKVKEAKQYSLNGEFYIFIIKLWWLINMYEKEDILKQADSVSNKIKGLELIKQYQNVEQQIHENSSIDQKWNN